MKRPRPLAARHHGVFAHGAVAEAFFRGFRSCSQVVFRQISKNFIQRHEVILHVGAHQGTGQLGHSDQLAVIRRRGRWLGGLLRQSQRGWQQQGKGNQSVAHGAS